MTQARSPWQTSLYALLLSSLTRRRVLTLASSAWWLGLRTRELRGRPGTPAQRLATLPVQFALEALATTELLVGSVRARTPVL